MMAPVGQASRQPARSQCLQTSLIMSHENLPSARSVGPSGTGVSTCDGEMSRRSEVGPGWPAGKSSANGRVAAAAPSRGLPWPGSGVVRSTKATCRQVEAPSCPVLSKLIPVKAKPSSGSWFHCLHATSHALQPMQSVVSVKKPHCSIARPLSAPPRRIGLGPSRLDGRPAAHGPDPRQIAGRPRARIGDRGAPRRRSPSAARSEWRPATMVQVSAFDSWIETFGSATNGMSSFAGSPRSRPT